MCDNPKGGNVMSKKLTLLVPAFLAVFALLASGAATAEQKTPKKMPPEMWTEAKKQMVKDTSSGKYQGMVLVIDIGSLKKNPKSKHEAVHGYFTPEKDSAGNDVKEYIPPKKDDPFSEKLPGARLFSINVLVHNPHICWQAGGDWKCVTF